MSLGFFKTEQFKITNYASISGCGKCKLGKTCQSPKMKPYGKGRKSILFVGECPGEEEDEEGIPFIGRSGRLLDKMCQSFGLDTEKDIIKMNAVSCRPPKNRAPETEEIEACRPRVWREIKKHNPKVVVALGAVALESLIGHRTKDNVGAISSFRGWTIPDREHKCWIAPMFHPAYVLRQSKNPAVELVFRDDLERAIRYLGVPLPNWKEEKKCIQLLFEEDEIVKKLQSLKSNSTIAIDYEATGLKPQNEGHQIVSISIATDVNHSFAFPTRNMQYKKALRLYREICKEESIKKIAHNILFEDTWTREILHVDMAGWETDTRIDTHILDNRRGITGLKFQAVVQTGLFDYSSHLDKYLHTDKRKLGGNAQNQIHKAPEKALLMYNAIDALATYRLYELQQKQFEEIRKSHAARKTD